MINILLPLSTCAHDTGIASAAEPLGTTPTWASPPGAYSALLAHVGTETRAKPGGRGARASKQGGQEAGASMQGGAEASSQPTSSTLKPRAESSARNSCSTCSHRDRTCGAPTRPPAVPVQAHRQGMPSAAVSYTVQRGAAAATPRSARGRARHPHAPDSGGREGHLGYEDAAARLDNAVGFLEEGRVVGACSPRAPSVWGRLARAHKQSRIKGAGAGCRRDP